MSDMPPNPYRDRRDTRTAQLPEPWQRHEHGTRHRPERVDGVTIAVPDERTWVPVGPSVAFERLSAREGFDLVTGRVRDIAVDAAGIRAYVGTAKGGVWYTEDAGSTWRPIGGWVRRLGATGGADSVLAVGALLVAFGDDASEDFVIVGTGEADPNIQTDVSIEAGGIGILSARGPATRPYDEDPWERDLLEGFFEGTGTYRLARRPGRVAGAADDQVMAATDQGLLLGNRSADGGYDWTTPSPIYHDADGQVVDATQDEVVTDLLWLPSSGPAGRLFACFGNESDQDADDLIPTLTPAFSDDGGENFHQIHGSVNSTGLLRRPDGRASLAAAGSDDETRVYVLGAWRPASGKGRPQVGLVTNALGDRTDPTTRPRLRRLPGTPSKSRLWQKQQDYDQAIHVVEHGTGAAARDRVYLGGAARRSRRRSWVGSLWCFEVDPTAASPRLRPIAGISSTAPPSRSVQAGHIGDRTHADVHRIITPDDHPEIVWVGNDGGVTVSEQHGANGSFESRSNGIAALEVGFVASHPTSPHFTVIGCQDNGIIARTGATTWDIAIKGDGGGVAFDLARPHQFYGQHHNASWSGHPRQWFSGRQSWDAENGSDNKNAEFYSNTDVAEGDGGTVFLTLGTDRVFVAEHDGGRLRSSEWRVLTGVNVRENRTSGELERTGWRSSGRLAIDLQTDFDPAEDGISVVRWILQGGRPVGLLASQGLSVFRYGPRRPGQGPSEWRPLQYWALPKLITPPTPGQEIQQLGGQQGAVEDVAGNPRRREVAAAGADGTLRIWGRRNSRQPRPLTGHAGAVSALAWHPRGTRLVSGGADATIRIWNRAGAELRQFTGHQGTVNDVAWNHDGTRIASAGADGTVRIWNPTSGELRQLTGHQGAVNGVAWNDDGSRVASAGADATVRIWDPTGGQVQLLAGHTGAVRSVDWRADGTQLATGGADGTLRIWDPTGPELRQVSAHQGAVRSVAWHPTEDRLASAGDDTMLRTWDSSTGTERTELDDHDGAISSVTWSPSGRSLVSGAADGTVRIWDPNDLASWGHIVLTDLRPVPDSNQFYVTLTGRHGVQDTVYFYNGTDFVATGLGTEIEQLDPAYSVVIDPDDTSRLYVGTALGAWQGDRSADGSHRWDLIGRKLPPTFIQDLDVHQPSPNAPKTLVAALESRGVWHLKLDGAEHEQTYLRSHEFDDRRQFPTPLAHPRQANETIDPRHSPDVVVRPRPGGPGGSPPPFPGFNGRNAEQRRRLGRTNARDNAYHLWTFQTAFRTLVPAVAATGTWTDRFGLQIRQFRASRSDIADQPREAIDEDLWDLVLDTNPSPVYTPPWWRGANTPPATEADLRTVVPQAVQAGTWAVPSEPATVEVLIHHRDTEPVEAGDAFALLLWRWAPVANVSCAGVAAFARSVPLDSGVPAGGSPGWTAPGSPGANGRFQDWQVAMNGSSVLHRLAVPLDARMPTAVSIDIDLSNDPVTRVDSGHVVLLALAGSTVDRFTHDIPAATDPFGFVTNWRHAALRSLTCTGPRPTRS